MSIIFAVDTNLFCTGSDLYGLVCQIKREIKAIYAWVNVNKLSLNIDKTNFMLFTKKGFSRVMDKLQIEEKRIMEVQETKFVGVFIDDKLNWKPHIRYIYTKVAKGIGVIYWKLGKYSTMRHYPHCIVRLYTHMWIIVYMYWAEPMIPISMISVYYRKRSFES